MTNEMMFAGCDGTRLFMKQDLPKKPRAVLVLTHGVTEHQGRYDHLVGRLVDHDVAVYRYDHRGHGRSEGKTTYISSADELVGDLEMAVRMAEEDFDGMAPFVLGHSMGGMTATLFASRNPGRLRGVVLSGAFTRGTPTSHSPRDGRQLDDEYIANEMVHGVCSDFAVVKAGAADPFVAKKISLALLGALEDGVAWLRDNPDLFLDPVLALHGAQDGIVSEADSRDFYGSIAAKDKSLRIYAYLMHELFSEPARDEVIDDVLRWVEKRL